jgi:RNA polymerase sigma-70 factor (ECF subfamily)
MVQSQADLVGALSQVAAGDRAAFALLYDRTSAKLLATVGRILGQGAAAEDAMQEAYVRIWRHAGEYDARIASPIAWMTTIARHVAIDMVRSGPARVAAASTEIDAELTEKIAAPAGETDPAAAARLRDCLAKLADDRRGMVVLAYCYGLSREELASRYSRPVATVKTILRRSLATLKDCLGG